VVKVKRVNISIAIAVNEHVSELQDVTCNVGSHSVTCHPTPVNASQPHRPVLDIPAWEGWKAELNVETVYPWMITHPSSNWAWCRVTSLIETNALTTTPLCHPRCSYWRHDLTLWWHCYLIEVKWLKPSTALNRKPTSELRSITCLMGSHSVTCHPTQVNAPRHNPSQPGQYSIYLPRKDGRLSRPRLLDSGPTGNRAHNRLIASPTP